MKTRKFSELHGALAFADGLLQRGGTINSVQRIGGKWVVEYEE